ncbi:MAG: 3-deoxy-manno-octulosonate cytidylyltransferase [Calditrichia bacterium]
MSDDIINIVIPARYQSERFPGKILHPVAGKPLLKWVYEEASRVKNASVIVLPDNKRVADYLEKEHIPFIMTSESCSSGTERIASVINKLKGRIIINLQADEPLITKQILETLIEFMEHNPDFPIATLASREYDLSVVESPHRVKVVLDSKNKALYFSRALIPFPRANPDYYLVHVGLYGYRREFLEKFGELLSGPLEKSEKLEQLQFLYNGYSIGVAVGSFDLHGVDVPEDVAIVEKKMRELKRYD